jgi:NADH:ubiquinone oxidoreductase subunit F (NADH-binding)/NADH:ubiquinone oxidoreductase subunit E
MVVESLRAIQDKHGYIPEQELYALAARLNKPVYEIHGVATFYPHFRLKPPPKATVHICTDLPCHMRGAETLLARAKAIAAGETSVEVKNCSCLGQCDGAVAALINDHPHAGISHNEMMNRARIALEGGEVEHQEFEGLKGPFKSDPYDNPTERYSALKELAAAVAADPTVQKGIIDRIKAANLRGMGGGGFATWIKWNTVHDQKSEEKYIVCNGDESEVGTFKDREILRNIPHLVIEGMAIAGLATGATKGYLYIRHEYHEQINICEEEIKAATKLGILGDNVCGSGKAFHLEVFVSPGGYIQGEETALMEAIEGRRGQPRVKAIPMGYPTVNGTYSIPAFTGLFGKPTVINNVETYCYVPAIMKKGPEWFVSQGKNGSQGLKWIGVGGDVNRPGVFEVPMGTTYLEAIEMAGGMLLGKKLKGFAPSGPSFGFLPAAAASAPMDFPQFDKDRKPANEIAKVGGTVGSAAIVIVAEGTCMVDLALNFTRFYRNESCGKCVPCRLGSQKMVDIIAGITHGTAGPQDLAEIQRLGETMTLTSICGLGMVVHKPIESVMKHWPEEVQAHLKDKECPSGVCFKGGMPVQSNVENVNAGISLNPRGGEQAGNGKMKGFDPRDNTVRGV